MKCEIVELKDIYACVEGGTLSFTGLDDPIGNDEWVRPMVIVIPGGAYRFVSKREGEPIAADFLAKGYQVAVLQYLCCEQGAKYPEQLYELACAVDYIKKNAKRLRVNPEEIFLVGFSAGGHLVADYSNEHFSLRERGGVRLETTATAVGLAYPVIDDHEDSFENLLCGYDRREKESIKKQLDLTRRVNEKTPPTFLWTTAEDGLVPAQNSLRYALALADGKIPYELHVFPKGGHGMANGSMELNENEIAGRILSVWTGDMCRFFRSFCREKY